MHNKWQELRSRIGTRIVKFTRVLGVSMKAGDTVAVATIAARDVTERPDFAVSWRPPLWALRTAVRAARRTKHVTPNMLSAIAARETAGLNVFQYGMPRTDGCGVGPWQITANVDWSNPLAPLYPGYGNLLEVEVSAHVAAAEFLDPLLARFPDSHLAAFAGFNAGGGAVAEELARHLSPDAWTTGADYGADVFVHWINFSAASFAVNADWAHYKWVS